MTTTTDWVCDFFTKRGKLDGKDRKAQLALDIFDSGMVDSFGTVELVSEIESQFNIELTADDMEDSRFQTIGGLAEIIDHRVERSQAG